jgi:MFS family permease
MALIYGVGGILGTYLGGELAARHAACNERLQLKTMAVVAAGSAVLSVATYLSSNAYLGFGLLALISMAGSAINGPLFATIQTLVSENMRATSVALIYLFANLVGMGFGPLAVGVLSDALRPWSGDESLRYALVALSPGYFWAAWHLRQASQTVTQDIGRMHGAASSESSGDLVPAEQQVADGMRG